VWGNYKPCKSAVIVLGRKESRREERRRKEKKRREK